ncbi:hypothetical protein [Bacillus sp. 2205SS5-2]|uniref:hypothetical protein n=1 Tax=Bacillus sp. 2205SS5-2 TaxID=3109031 RepID=UPI0030077A6D
MKKLWWLAIAALIIVVAGCGSNEAESEKTGEETKQTDEKAVKSALMDTYLNLIVTVNGSDISLNEFEGSMETLEGEELQTAKAAAVDSAAQSAEAVRSIDLSDELGEHKEDIQSALDTLVDSYELKAEELKKEGEMSLDEANAKFTEADEKIANTLEAVGLSRSSIEKELNG